MKKMRASELFHQVDPNLRVIDGGTRQHKTPLGNWEASGGAFCPKCHQEVVRFRPEDGLCRQCADELNEKHFNDEKKRDKFLRFVKAHNARIDKRRR